MTTTPDQIEAPQYHYLAPGIGTDYDPTPQTHRVRLAFISFLAGGAALGGIQIGTHWDINNPFSHNSASTMPGDSHGSNPNVITVTPAPSESPTPTPSPSMEATPSPSATATKLPAVVKKPAAPVKTEITAFFAGDSLTEQAILGNDEKGFLKKDKVEVHADWAGGAGITTGPAPNVTGVQGLVDKWLVNDKTDLWVPKVRIVRIGVGPNMSESGATSPWCDSLPGLRGAKQLNLPARQFCTALGGIIQQIHTAEPTADVIVPDIASETHKAAYDERNDVVFAAAKKYGYTPEDIYTATHPGGHPTNMELDAHNAVTMQHTPGDAIDDYLHPTAMGYQKIFALDQQTIDKLRIKK